MIYKGVPRAGVCVYRPGAPSLCWNMQNIPTTTILEKL